MSHTIMQKSIQRSDNYTLSNFNYYVGHYRLLSQEALNIAHVLKIQKASIGDYPAFAADALHQEIMGRRTAPLIKEAAPKFDSMLVKVRHLEYEALYVHNLPTTPENAHLLSLGLAYIIGSAWNYQTERGGHLVTEVRPKAAGDLQSAAARGWHSEDAFFLSPHRPDFIGLLGVRASQGTCTGFLPARSLLDALQDDVIKILAQARFSKLLPASLGLGEAWSRPTPLLTLGDYQRIEVSCETYGIRAADPKDLEAVSALRRLLDVLRIITDPGQCNAVFVSVEPGSYFLFNNKSGLHMRSAIGSVDRLVHRTYMSDSLDALKIATGHEGPLFDAKPLVADRLN